MFTSPKLKTVKLWCPKCEYKFKFKYHKDIKFKSVEYACESSPVKKLAAMRCPFCKIELLIIKRENRLVWEHKYDALDQSIERELQKFQKEQLDRFENYSESDLKDTELCRLKSEQLCVEYVEWERNTKAKLDYK